MTAETACANARPPTVRDRLRVFGRALRFRLGLAWGATGYRPWARLLHRLNLHHTKTLYLNGGRLTLCDWCGLRQRAEQTYRKNTKRRARTTEGGATDGNA